MSQGIINRAEVDEIHHLILEKGMELPLHWERGSWKFQEREELTFNRIDPAFILSIPPSTNLECDWSTP